MDDELIKRVAVATAKVNRAQQSLNDARGEMDAACNELHEAQLALRDHQEARIKAVMAEMGDQ